MNNFKNMYKKITHFLVLRDNWAYAPVSSSQWTESDACRLKTVGGVGFEVTRNITFQEHSFYNMYNRKINYYNQEPIEGIKVNISWYPSNYCYTSKKKLGWFPLQHTTFLIFISQKILLNVKDVEFDLRMGCILVLFLFLWIINVQFTNFGFLNF